MPFSFALPTLRMQRWVESLCATTTFPTIPSTSSYALWAWRVQPAWNEPWRLVRPSSTTHLRTTSCGGCIRLAISGLPASSSARSKRNGTRTHTRPSSGTTMRPLAVMCPSTLTLTGSTSPHALPSHQIRLPRPRMGSRQMASHHRRP